MIHYSLISQKKCGFLDLSSYSSNRRQNLAFHYTYINSHWIKCLEGSS